MSNNPEEGFLTSGELAQACGVTVRTVQYYDERGLLQPTTRSGGGRRLYDDKALTRLQTICVLKELGLPLKAIRGVLESDGSPEVLRTLYLEQQKALRVEVEKRQKMLDLLDAELLALGEKNSVVAETTPSLPEQSPQDVLTTDHTLDMGHSMSSFFAEKGTRLRKTQNKMLLEGIILDIVQIVCIVGGIMTGNWWPLIAIIPLMAIIVTELVWMYHRDARYVCPHCHQTFQPSIKEFFFAAHTPKTRKLTCSSCGTKDWCIEIANPEE